MEGIQENELVPDLFVESTTEGDIYLNSIITQLKAKGYILNNTMLSYYSSELNGFIFCGVDPAPHSITVPSNELREGKLLLRAKVDPETIVESPEVQEKEQFKPKKTKKRKIGQIIDKLKIWRSYYNGYVNYYGKLVKLSLYEAASRVGIPKKSLDDYLLQIKLGKSYGFNYNKHKDDNIGVLRAFIKEARDKNSLIIDDSFNDFD